MLPFLRSVELGSGNALKQVRNDAELFLAAFLWNFVLLVNWYLDEHTGQGSSWTLMCCPSIIARPPNHDNCCIRNIVSKPQRFYSVFQWFCDVKDPECMLIFQFTFYLSA